MHTRERKNSILMSFAFNFGAADEDQRAVSTNSAVLEPVLADFVVRAPFEELLFQLPAPQAMVSGVLFCVPIC